MKKLISLVALGLTLAMGAAHAADEKATPQQNKMKTCNADAKTKDLKGDERKAFMKECLSAKGPGTEPAKTSPQEDAMNACKAEAQKLKGNARQEKMRACLKS